MKSPFKELFGQNSVAGSIFWMAPELFRGRGKLTTSSDIWSLGCCVLEMATGAAPWAERRFDNILQALRMKWDIYFVSFFFFLICVYICIELVYILYVSRSIKLV